ncbi:MAG: ATP-binding protein [Planctomycetota bacterium]|jgi:CO dehydrogenase maturation factor
MAGTLIAFSGKGGSGKTTLAAMIVRELIRTGNKPVLAVDADPNATLALTLGVSCPGTISDLRDDVLKAAQEPTEIPKERLVDQYLAELLGEYTGFDLLTMGRPEGPSCYCYVNGLLRRYLSLLRSNYPFVVVDCEAGMEYLSRLTVEDVDTLVLTGEPTEVGLRTIERIAEMSHQLPLNVHRRVVAVNKIGAPGMNVQPADVADRLPPSDAAVYVPFDEDLVGRCAAGEPIDEAAGSVARQAIEQLTRDCLSGSGQTQGQSLKEPVS